MNVVVQVCEVKQWVKRYGLREKMEVTLGKTPSNQSKSNLVDLDTGEEAESNIQLPSRGFYELEYILKGHNLGMRSTV